VTHRAPVGRVRQLVIAAVVAGLVVGVVLGAAVWAIVGLAT
jgi:hypothetical protein